MLHTILISMPGTGEWFLIGFVVVLLFGSKKIPELAKGLGKGIREFKDATKEVKNEIKEGSEQGTPRNQS